MPIGKVDSRSGGNRCFFFLVLLKVIFYIWPFLRDYFCSRVLRQIQVLLGGLVGVLWDWMRFAWVQLG